MACMEYYAARKREDWTYMNRSEDASIPKPVPEDMPSRRSFTQSLRAGAPVILPIKLF